MAVSNDSLENSSIFNNQFSQVNIKESSKPVLEAWLGQTSGGRTPQCLRILIVAKQEKAEQGATTFRACVSFQ